MSDIVEVTTFVVSPEVLKKARFAVAEKLSERGVFCNQKLAEEVAYEALKAAYAARKGFDWAALQAIRKASP